MDKLLKDYDQQEQKQLLRLALKIGHPLMSSSMKHLDLSNDDLLDVCRQGNQLSLRVIGNQNLKDIRDSNGNTCFHEAAKAGNIKMLKLLSKSSMNNVTLFNSRNNRGQTPLLYALKNNNNNYAQTAIFLLNDTDLSLCDNQDKLPHQVNIALNESRARILEKIEQQYKQRHL